MSESQFMSWKLKSKLRASLGREQGAVTKDWGGKISVALVYPNTYEVGMGNLAVHSLYRILNDRPDIVCERAFLPSKRDLAEHRRTETPILSLESQRPLAEFDAVAFSISFENDYLNILPILELANIPYLKEKRSKDAPLVIAGGAAPTLNPDTISKIFDAVITGEAECYVEDLIPALTEGLSKKDLIAEFTRLKGGRFLKNLNDWPTETVIHSEDAEFGDMHLIEVQRGCPHHCKFCAVPVIYQKPRHRNIASILHMVENGLQFRKRFGLIGTHILSHPDFIEIAKAIHSRGATFSPSSIRVDEIDETRAALLAKSGHRSIALGIEAGMGNLRETLDKRTSDGDILSAVATLAAARITNLRLYFMIGLPGESEKDIEAIASLGLKVQKTLIAHAPRESRTTKVALTVTPFVPKPGTNFEKAAFAGTDELKQKIKTLRRHLSNQAGIELGFDNPVDSAIEHFLSNGDSDTISFLEEAHRSGNARQALC